MNKRAIVFFTIFLTSFNASANQNIPTIKDYLNDENKKYDSYIYGLESGLEWASEFYYRKHQIEIYCKPSNVESPVSELRVMIDRTIAAKPGFFKKYENEPLLGLALRNGYIEAFPCQ